MVLLVALLGGVGPAALSALISGLLLNYFFAAPLYSFTIAEPDNFITTVVLLVVAVAVAVLVDEAAKRAGRRAGPRRRPNCWHCSPVRCCAARTCPRCWRRCGRPTRSVR